MSRLNPDVEAVARRLSYSPASPPRTPSPRNRRQPALPAIAEHPGEQQEAETPASPPSPWTSRRPPRPPSRVPASAPHTPPSPRTSRRSPRPPSQVPASAPHTVQYAASPITPSPAPPVSPFHPQEAAASTAMLRELEWRRAVQLQLQLQQAWVAAAVQSESQQPWLYTLEGNPAGYETNWDELHPVSQKLLLQIEEKIMEYGYDSEQLDQSSRLYGSSVYINSFVLDASRITQGVGLISNMMDKKKASIQSLMAVIEGMMFSTDFAIRSYVELRKRFTHRGAVKRPSPFMQQTVARFEMQLEECCKLIGELEQLVQLKNDKTYPSSLESLAKVLSNVHDYFIHVASKVETFHQQAEKMRTQYFNDRRHMGNWNDPFLEANRKEVPSGFNDAPMTF